MRFIHFAYWISHSLFVNIRKSIFLILTLLVTTVSFMCFLNTSCLIQEYVSICNKLNIRDSVLIKKPGITLSDISLILDANEIKQIKTITINTYDTSDVVFSENDNYSMWIYDYSDIMEAQPKVSSGSQIESSENGIILSDNLMNYYSEGDIMKCNIDFYIINYNDDGEYEGFDTIRKSCSFVVCGFVSGNARIVSFNSGYNPPSIASLSDTTVMDEISFQKESGSLDDFYIGFVGEFTTEDGTSSSVFRGKDIDAIQIVLDSSNEHDLIVDSLYNNFDNPGIIEDGEKAYNEFIINNRKSVFFSTICLLISSVLLLFIFIPDLFLGLGLNKDEFVCYFLCGASRKQCSLALVVKTATCIIISEMLSFLVIMATKPLFLELVQTTSTVYNKTILYTLLFETLLFGVVFVIAFFRLATNKDNM